MTALRNSDRTVTTSRIERATPEVCSEALSSSWAANPALLTRLGTRQENKHQLELHCVDTLRFQVSERMYSTLAQKLEGSGHNLLPPSLAPGYNRLRESGTDSDFTLTIEHCTFSCLPLQSSYGLID